MVLAAHRAARQLGEGDSFRLDWVGEPRLADLIMTMRKKAPRRFSEVRRLVVLQMKPGWRFDRRRRRFERPDGESFSPAADLPRGTRIELLDEDLAEADPGVLDEDERILARTVNLTVPPGSDPDRLKEKAEAWPCKEEVWAPPAPSPAGP